MENFANWQRVEGLLVFLAGVAVFLAIDSGLGWWALPLFFAPDLSFLAYTLGARAGGAVYNSVHIYGFGAALLALGTILALPPLAALGALWLAHSGFDRIFGYGLKSAESFSITHMGRIGKTRSEGV